MYPASWCRAERHSSTYNKGTVKKKGKKEKGRDEWTLRRRESVNSNTTKQSRKMIPKNSNALY